MVELSDIFSKYRSEYFIKFGSRMLPSHIRAFNDIIECRTENMGGHIEQCDSCDHREYVYHSCCNRSCPKCHGFKSPKWFEQRKSELLPVNYFHIVFTIPGQLRYIARSNQKILDILMKASAYSLQKLAKDPKYLGGKISVLSVLHTWTRTMVYHPHAHCLVPGGGVSNNNKYWIESKTKFFLPVRALSRIFRGKFIEILNKEFPTIKMPKSIWKKEWVIYSKAGIYGTEKILEYLSRYICKIAITNNRIISEKNGFVTFKYRDSKDNKWKFMTLDAIEFIRRYLQHVLHKGFHKIRYYGLFSPVNKKSLKKIKKYFDIMNKNKNSELSEPASNSKDDNIKEPENHNCTECMNGCMIIIKRIPRLKKYNNGRAPPC